MELYNKTHKNVNINYGRFLNAVTLRQSKHQTPLTKSTFGSRNNYSKHGHFTVAKRGFFRQQTLCRCSSAALLLTRRRLGEVGGSTAHNSDYHCRLKDTTEIRIITSPPNFAKPPVMCCVSLLRRGKFSVAKTTVAKHGHFTVAETPNPTDEVNFRQPKATILNAVTLRQPKHQTPLTKSTLGSQNNYSKRGHFSVAEAPNPTDEVNSRQPKHLF